MILIDKGEALKTKHVYFVCFHNKDDQGIFLLYPFQTVNPVGRLLGLSKTVNTVDETLPEAQRTQKLTPRLGINLATTWRRLH